MSLIPAAQYLRMSTEHQQYSLQNQEAAIVEFAEQHGFQVVRTYSDGGRSGLQLKRRLGLQELLHDVVSGTPGYSAILVYDVSRWGRFQDADEAATYEFICKSAGIPIHYCAEQFNNDDTVGGLLLKALKRAMAAEYSRELGVKVYEGKRRLAGMGFRQGGRPGYGLRRAMIAGDGKRKQALCEGEYKNLTTDRVILEMGPEEERKWVSEIFRLARKIGSKTIARYLNTKGVKNSIGRDWTMWGVYRLLRNPKYAGHHIWGKNSVKLHAPSKKQPQNLWVRGRLPFQLVDDETFESVQEAIDHRGDGYTDAELLARVKKLLKKRGKLTERMIEYSGLPSTSTFFRHFGDLKNLYKLVGFKPPKAVWVKSDHRIETLKRRDTLLAQICAVDPSRFSTYILPGRFLRPVVLIDREISVSVLLCRSYRTDVQHAMRWSLVTRPRERGCITLICLSNEDNTGFFRFVLVPRIDFKFRQYEIKGPDDPWLRSGLELNSIGELLPAVLRMHASRTRAA